MQADAHVTTAVAQVERMSMALRAIPDNRDFLGLNQRQICIIVVINLGHLSLLETSNWGFIKLTATLPLPAKNRFARPSANQAQISFRATLQLVQFSPFQEFQM